MSQLPWHPEEVPLTGGHDFAITCANVDIATAANTLAQTEVKHSPWQNLFFGVKHLDSVQMSMTRI